MEPIWILVAILALTGLSVVALVRWLFRKREHRPQPRSGAPLRTIPTGTSAPRAPGAAGDHEPPILLRGSPAQVSVRVVATSYPGAFERQSQSANRDARKLWIAPGTAAKVGQWTLPRGALYVGSDLADSRTWSGGTEPALIDPRLAADPKASYRQDYGVGYWPSYASISPAARGAYLNWLATGTLDDPAAYIGYVFLFFYGLERRILVDPKTDAAARADTAAITRIVRDLHRVYAATNASFARYCTEFLNLLDTRRAPDVDRPPPVEALVRRADDQALRIRLGLGLRVRGGLPIDLHWALCWARNDPDITLRLPANRCVVEFNQLFARRFTAKYPKGLSVPENKTPLRVAYQPASRGIEPVLEAVEVDGRPVPDVTVLKRPKQAIQAIAEACMEDLEAYSRWVGRNLEGRDALPGLALLPKELLRERQSQSLERFIARLDAAVSGPEGGLLDAAELFRVWPTAQPDRFSKPEAVGLFQLIESLGYGIEPDVRFGGPRLAPGQRVALFTLPPNAPTAPTPEYAEAATLLLLAAQVSQADRVSEAEERHLEGLIEERFRLSPPERTRLRAHLRFLLVNPVDTAGLKKRMAALPRADAESIADDLVAVAAADGRIDPEEVQILGRLNRLLGLDEPSLHRRLHAAVAGPQAPTGAPAAAKLTGPASATPPGVVLDLDRLRQRQESTNRVAALLQGVFAGDDDQPAAASTAAAAPDVPRVDGLDAAHTGFFLALGESDAWDRQALAALAARFRLMPDGAVDRLNEAAFERCDAPLLDGDDDTYTLDRDTWETLRHGQAA